MRSLLPVALALVLADCSSCSDAAGPALDRVPEVPWYDPRFDADRFELFLIGRASRML